MAAVLLLHAVAVLLRFDGCGPLGWDEALRLFGTGADDLDVDGCSSSAVILEAFLDLVVFLGSVVVLVFVVLLLDDMKPVQFGARQRHVPDLQL